MATNVSEKNAITERKLKKYWAKVPNDIKEVKVESESPTMITIGWDGLLKRVIRVRKVSQNEGWFDTWEEAKEFLLLRANEDLKHSEKLIQTFKKDVIFIKERLDRLQSLVKPEVPLKEEPSEEKA